jgi:hypothetical protein
MPASIKEAAWAPWRKWALIAGVVTWIVGSGGSYGFLAALVVLIGPFVLWWGKVNACVECKKWFKRETTSVTRTVKNTNRSLTHGRMTKKGAFDQRPTAARSGHASSNADPAQTGRPRLQ